MQSLENTPKIAIIIPCYNCAKLVPKVVQEIPASISKIYVVDDACPQNSGKAVQKLKDKRVSVLFHKENQGVGAAMLTGYHAALADDMDILVKIDGDGQMAPAHLPTLLQPLLTGAADYSKGSRMHDSAALKTMPKLRLLGNALFGFATKLATGYWGMLDPVNGYTAITRTALLRLEEENLAPRYFFETSMLLELSLTQQQVTDVPLPARYGTEVSQLRIHKHLIDFVGKTSTGLIKRIWRQYFLQDFNMASIYLLLGLPLLMFGLLFGLNAWCASLHTGIPRTTGTVMLAVLPTIIGLQFLLQAIAIDIARGEKLFTLWRSDS